MDKILNAREARYNEVLELTDKYKLPVLCGKINYPGNNKNSVEVYKAFNVLAKLLINEFGTDIVISKIINGDDGPAFVMVLEINPLKAKNIAVFIEEYNKIGRVFDIDIYLEDGTSISRSDISLEPRKCVICNGNPRVCNKLSIHNLEEVLAVFNDIININNFQ